MELPPESVFREPTSGINEPSAPARAIAYIGLCGLLLVSLSERLGMTAPLILAAVSGDTFSKIPRKKAESE